jgi:hypothetical protein
MKNHTLRDTNVLEYFSFRIILLHAELPETCLRRNTTVTKGKEIAYVQITLMGVRTKERKKEY